MQGSGAKVQKEIISPRSVQNDQDPCCKKKEGTPGDPRRVSEGCHHKSCSSNNVQGSQVKQIAKITLHFTQKINCRGRQRDP